MTLPNLIGIASIAIAGLSLIRKGQAAGSITVNPLGIKIGQTSTGSKGLVLDLEVFNPSNGSITVTAVSGSALFNNSELGTIEFAGSKKINARGYTKLPVFIRPNSLSILATIISAFSQSNKRNSISISGSVYAGDINAPFQKSIQI